MTFNDIAKSQQHKHPDVEGNYIDWKYTQELYNRIELVENELAVLDNVDDWVLDEIGQVKDFIQSLQPLEDEK